ncbi:unnamed protein product [Prunus armeniaca]|uniref:Uncharacterized protein n=1 Tax=Prunus armeniaca TaxID=36596 RepID=A0A6J5VAC8_PRUAR|nr:unnamed protein product [Prunus armeniaca]
MGGSAMRHSGTKEAVIGGRTTMYRGTVMVECVRPSRETVREVVAGASYCPLGCKVVLALRWLCCWRWNTALNHGAARDDSGSNSWNRGGIHCAVVLGHGLSCRKWPCPQSRDVMVT